MTSFSFPLSARTNGEAFGIIWQDNRMKESRLHLLHIWLVLPISFGCGGPFRLDLGSTPRWGDTNTVLTSFFHFISCTFLFRTCSPFTEHSLYTRDWRGRMKAKESFGLYRCGISSFLRKDRTKDTRSWTWAMSHEKQMTRNVHKDSSAARVNRVVGARIVRICLAVETCLLPV